MIEKMKRGRERKTGYFCEVIRFSDEDGNSYAKKSLLKAHSKNDDYQNRLVREIDLLEKLQGHKNIIELTKYEKAGVDSWYLMPYAKQNLYDYIKENNQSLTKKDRYKIASQVIDAIKYAHDRNILHRDISPSNVMVFEIEGKTVIKVCDFGLGKSAESLSYYTHSSAKGYGQPFYVAPEQHSKLKSSTIKSDIYSLGKLIYFIFTGRDPNNYKSFDLDTLYHRATEENPDNRHANMTEFKKHFKALKDLELNQDIPLEHLTLNDIVKEGEMPSWLAMHKLIKEANRPSHVYSDYLGPVFKIFSIKPNRLAYHNAVGSSIVEGLNAISVCLFECYRSYGWDFKETRTFGTVLRDFILEIPNAQVKLICLKHLWHLAVIMDQWAVMRTAQYVFTPKYITPDIETQLAEFIIKSQGNVSKDLVNSFPDPPKSIKSAIIKVVQNAEKD